MGNILKIPCYAYFDDETFQQNLIIYTSNNLFNRIQTGMYYRFSGSVLDGNLIALVNNTLGETVISNKLNTLITCQSSDDIDLIGSCVDRFGLSYQVIRPTNNSYWPTKCVCLNGFEIVNPVSPDQSNALVSTGPKLAYHFFNFGCLANGQANNIRVWGSGLNQMTLQLTLTIYPENIFVNGAINPNYFDGSTLKCLRISVAFDLDPMTLEPTPTLLIIDTGSSTKNKIITQFTGFSTDYAMIEELDTSNPYTAGDSDQSSTIGGGDGQYGNIDDVDPTDIPDLPTIGAGATGFITLYNPTSSVLSSLGSFLWSNLFDIDTYKKLFGDPMDCIIGLGIVPALPSSSGAQNIKFGNVDTGISCTTLGSQYAKKDCGSVNIKKYVGSFMDYSPYVKISLFLPYIGFVNLGTDDIMGGSINIVYNIDVLTGDCIAFIKHSEKGVLYSYHGNCLTNVPVSGQNYAGALKNYYESVAGIIPATTNGATGGPAGAIGGAIAGTLQSASNIILNSKPTFQRSGNIGGSAGIMGVQKPFIIIERPHISVPDRIEHFAGQTSNITMNLGACSGYTLVDSVHLNGISATSQELKEIESLLKGGVIL